VIEPEGMMRCGWKRPGYLAVEKGRSASDWNRFCQLPHLLLFHKWNWSWMRESG